MRYWLLFIFSLGLSLPGWSQKADSVSYSSGGPEIWLDYGKVLLYATDFESKLEGGLTWRIGAHWAPVVAFGRAELSPGQAIKNGNYTSTGQYFRVGLEYYQAINEKNRMIFGVRYGQSAYDETGDYVINSTLWPTVESEFDRKGLKSSWGEVLIGSEMTLYKSVKDDDVLYPSRWKLGGYLGVRFLATRDKYEPVDTYAIPGYGRTIDQSIPFLNVFIKYSLHR